jgi:hypothetical protein
MKTPPWRREGHRGLYEKIAFTIKIIRKTLPFSHRQPRNFRKKDIRHQLHSRSLAPDTGILVRRYRMGDD